MLLPIERTASGVLRFALIDNSRLMPIDVPMADALRILRIHWWKPAQLAQLSAAPAVNYVGVVEFKDLKAHALKAPAAPKTPVKKVPSYEQRLRQQEVARERAFAKATKAAIAAGRDYALDQLADGRSVADVAETVESVAVDIADGMAWDFPELNRSDLRSLADYVSDGMDRVLRARSR